VFSVVLDHVTGAHGYEVLQHVSILPKCRTEGMVTGIGVLPVKEGRHRLIRVFCHLKALAAPLGKSAYGVYLLALIEERAF
jgi:hypothetical protein